MERNRSGRAKSWYAAIALHVLNTLVLVLIVNIALAFIFRLRDIRATQTATFSSELYHDVSNAHYATDVLKTFSTYRRNAFVYQPWAQHGPTLVESNYVNVHRDELGFPVRKTVNPKSEIPAIRIFTFGGSTTFGYLVPDDQTWPSHLSRILNDRISTGSGNYRVEVTNYGRISSFPSEETAVFIDLLKSGHRPHLAIFMDGVNLGPEQDIGVLSETIKDGFRELQKPQLIGPAGRKIPIVRLASWIQRHYVRSTTGGQQSKAKTLNAQHYANRFAAHQEISSQIGRQYEVDSIFVLQPKQILSRPNNKARQAFDHEIETLLKSLPGWLNLLHLADAYTLSRKWTLNGIHYTPNFSKFLAQRVASEIDLSKFEPTTVGVDYEAATGAPRTKDLVSLRPGPAPN